MSATRRVLFCRDLLSCGSSREIAALALIGRCGYWCSQDLRICFWVACFWCLVARFSLRLRPGFFAWPEGFDFCAITARYALGPVGARSLHREAARRTTVPNPRQAGARCRRFARSSTAGLGAQVSADLAPRGALDRYLAERGAGRLQASFGPGRPSGRSVVAGGASDERRGAARCSAPRRDSPDVLAQMICARVLARSAYSQGARDRQIWRGWSASPGRHLWADQVADLNLRRRPREQPSLDPPVR